MKLAMEKTTLPKTILINTPIFLPIISRKIFTTKLSVRPALPWENGFEPSKSWECWRWFHLSYVGGIGIPEN